MWVSVDRLAVIVLDASLAATMLLSLVALFMLGCRQPARRLRLARTAIVCSLALIPLAAVAPWPRVDLVGALLRSGLIPEREAGLDDTPPTQAAASAAAHENAKVPESAAFDQSAFPPPRTVRIITLLYLGGMTVGLAFLVLGCGGLVWITRHSQDPCPTALALYQSLPFEGKGERPRLRVMNRFRRPVLLGTFRQIILIPAELQLTEYSTQLKLSLLHELAHSEGADYWFSLTGSVAQAFWFFLPPLWWIRAQMRLDHEFLADRRAAHGFGPLRQYASSLLDLANPDPGSTVPQGSSPPVPAQAGDGSSALFLRMLMLVKCPFVVEQRPPALWSWALPSLVVVAALGASSLTMRAPIPGERSCAASPPAVSAGSRVFRVARLLIPQRAGNAHGRTPVFELPMRLPAEFELTLDVWGDSGSIGHIRVVGLPLELKEAPPADPSTAQGGWHSVQVKRERTGLRLHVDGHPVAINSEATITSWLSVEPPPDQSCRFQNLKLTW